MMREVWIVQPYVPSYRVRFFEELSATLDELGVTLRVVAGQPDSVQSMRGDAVTPQWLTQATTRAIHAFGKSVTLTRTHSYWRNADAVIVPHMGSSLDSSYALMRASNLKVGVWGHIASYTSKAHPADAAIERWQLRRADHVFAYTPGGAKYAYACGVSPEKVSVVMNAIDTDALISDAATLTREDIEEFKTLHRIPTAHLFGYIGGLDSSKRVDFLAATLNELHQRRNNIHLLVGGTGDQINLLEEARARGQVSLLGYVNSRQKATLLGMSTAILNPGRVGLLAVDALIMKRPILTTKWPYHAPEIEYLHPGTSLFASDDSVSAYANLIESFVPPREETWSTSQVPTIEKMVHNFSRGVISMLES
ncbi:glycosyltransferase family 4 protein [uncultured Microbacterium sp.]|uniref:glycosyltransferase family 4 protein n=1 Tax=uncultured Microbacterium sp. TaxID=191216 RepID=UPI003413908C